MTCNVINFMKQSKFLPRCKADMANTMPMPATAAIAAVLLLCAGCAERRPRPFPWATAMNVKPRVPEPAPGYKLPAVDLSAPDLPWKFVLAQAALIFVRQPARPRVAIPTPQTAGENAKSAPPMLAPQLSDMEIADAQQQMNQSITVAQRNLANAKTRQLNATQIDLAAKVNSFLDESKSAVRDGDWTRAKNLAKKAQVLSEELAQSL